MEAKKPETPASKPPASPAGVRREPGPRPSAKATGKEGDVEGGDRRTSPDFLAVKPGFVLLWPDSGLTRRGGPGTIVPPDDPLIFCEVNGDVIDQRHKLWPAPEGTTEATAHDYVWAARVYGDLGYKKVPYVPHPDAPAPMDPNLRPRPVSPLASRPSDDDMEVPERVGTAASTEGDGDSEGGKEES